MFDARNYVDIVLASRKESKDHVKKTLQCGLATIDREKCASQRSSNCQTLASYISNFSTISTFYHRNTEYVHDHLSDAVLPKIREGAAHAKTYWSEKKEPEEPERISTLPW